MPKINPRYRLSVARTTMALCIVVGLVFTYVNPDLTVGQLRGSVYMLGATLLWLVLIFPWVTDAKD